MRKTALVAVAIGSLAISAPAFACGGGCNWSTSGNWNPPTGTSGESSTSGTEVPEPGMLGLAGLGLIGLGAIRLRRRRK